MTRKLYIGVCCDNPRELPAHNDRRLYSDPAAAWRWLDAPERTQPRDADDVDTDAVYEVDLEEVVRISRQPAPTLQARYEHAERRATKWLALRDELEPFVRNGEPIPPVAKIPEQDFEMHEWPPKAVVSRGVLFIHRRTGLAVVQTDGARLIDNLRIASERLHKMIAELGYGDGSRSQQELFLDGRNDRTVG